MKVIKYGADWCIPCKMLEESLKELGVEFISIDVEENNDMVEQKKIKSIPYLEIINDKNEVIAHQVGFKRKEELVNFLKTNKIIN